MSALVKPEQLREALYGITLVSPAAVVPNAAPGNLWAVSGGPIRITAVVAVVTTVFTGTVTTFNMGTAAGATTLFSAAALTSLTVGAVLVGVPTTQTPIVAASGNITIQASAANTGQLQVYLSYIPIIAASIAQ